ncbi:serine/threonine-protein kinase Nek5 isoform X2 [Patella vulgata]|uniref:serine/threonine-protein kinase Nek5 isoform X2 n=1 Tax=Patella vulgata TaxID=6465 RepID=UPI00217F6D90|nr:serine/threonine-protein kinase Nek5 isoform X2 [Patella vulgata]
MELIRRGEHPEVYSLGEILGAGTYGKVYLATAKNGEQSAIKQINVEDLRHDTAEMENFAREINNLSSLTHKNILCYLDSWQDDERAYIYIKTEYCSKKDLWNYVNATGIPDEQQLRSWIYQIASALKHMHERGYIHRNVKPANVMVIEDLTLKLGDFGTSRLIPKSSILTTVIGTPYFMCPEMLNYKSYSKPADIWSFGCLCYAIATLKVMNEGTSFKDIMKSSLRLKNREVVRNIPFSDCVKNLIGQMLSFFPDDRPTADEIMDKVKSCEDGSEANAHSDERKLTRQQSECNPKSKKRKPTADESWFPRNIDLSKTCPAALHYSPINKSQPTKNTALHFSPNRSQPTNDTGAVKTVTKSQPTESTGAVKTVTERQVNQPDAQFEDDLKDILKEKLGADVYEVGLNCMYQNDDDDIAMTELKGAIGDENYREFDVFFAKLRSIHVNSMGTLSYTKRFLTKQLGDVVFEAALNCMHQNDDEDKFMAELKSVIGEDHYSNLHTFFAKLRSIDRH